MRFLTIVNYFFHRRSVYCKICETPQLAKPECCIDSGKYYDQLAYLKEPTSCKTCPANSVPRLNGYFCESCPVGYEPMEDINLYGCQPCPEGKEKKEVGPGKCVTRKNDKKKTTKKGKK